MRERKREKFDLIRLVLTSRTNDLFLKRERERERKIFVLLDDRDRFEVEARRSGENGGEC